jgi:hypothetical protein
MPNPADQTSWRCCTAACGGTAVMQPQATKPRTIPIQPEDVLAHDDED